MTLKAADYKYAAGNSPALGVSGQRRLLPSGDEADSTMVSRLHIYLFIIASVVWYKTQASFVSCFHTEDGSSMDYMN